jgi:hypothetical protein
LINFYIEESTKNLREKIKNFLEERYSNGWNKTFIYKEWL